MARENEYLKVFQGQHVLGVGAKGTKKAHVSSLKPSTKYTDLKVAYDTTSDNSLSKEASEAVAVPEFSTKQTTTSTTTTTKKPEPTSTTTTSTTTTTKKPEEPEKPSEG